jgi:dienelactone hydrolase
MTGVTLIDALEGFDSERQSLAGRTLEVWRRGTGPAVVIVHEVPGITPLVAAFARRVADRGMTAVLPSLFGTPGRPPTTGYAARTLARACVSREFALLATGRASPVTDALRELGAREHERCGGPGVGAVGMCLTGGFALALAAEERLLAPVLSQPSLPLPMGTARRRDLGVSPEQLAAVRRRAAEGLCVLGLRFSEDTKSPAERFARLREELGPAFEGVEIDSSPGNPWGFSRHAHSVLTEDYRDDAGSPTRHALERVLSFLAEHLGVA